VVEPEELETVKESEVVEAEDVVLSEAEPSDSTEFDAETEDTQGFEAPLRYGDVDK
jgi:hypothetical protein